MGEVVPQLHVEYATSTFPFAGVCASWAFTSLSEEQQVNSIAVIINRICLILIVIIMFVFRITVQNYIVFCKLTLL